MLREAATVVHIRGPSNAFNCPPKSPHVPLTTLAQCCHLKLSLNPGVTQAFMRLVLNFVKLHYVLSTISEVKVLLSLYALAYKVSNSGRMEGSYLRFVQTCSW